MKFISQLFFINVLIAFLPFSVDAQDLAYGEPESLGFSTERLGRLEDAFNDYAQSGDLPGGVF